jgi:hypothetical protein
MIRRSWTLKALEAELKKDGYLRTQFFVAEKLGLTLSELRTRITDTELLGWYTYFKIQSDEEQEAYEKAKRGSRRR